MTSHQPRPHRIAFVITVVLTACAVAQMRCVAFSADHDRPARVGAERNIGEHASPHRSRWNGGHGAHPRGDVRVHVGPVLPYGFGPYNFPQYGDYRSRAGYHVVDKVTTSPSRMPASTMPDATTYLSWALQGFRNGNYREAMKLLRHALIEDQRDGTLYLLLSQTQLAVGEYKAAAESLRRGLALLNRADWGHAVENRRPLYANGDHDTHLRMLADFIDQNPNATYARFLRGYHTVFLGQVEAAREDLRKAAESTRYVNPALGLLGMMEDGITGRLRLEELPTPTDPATKRSR